MITQTTVVLDIDGVLACSFADSLNEVAFFKNHGAIITSKTDPHFKTHYIFPGVLEFLRLLYSTENLRVSFFSSGGSERNRILVKKLLKLSLGGEKYKEIANQVDVLSHSNLVPLSYKQKRELWLDYGLPNQKLSKDLSIIQNATLENTILIDDNPSNVAWRQVKNFFYVPTSSSFYYKRSFSKECVYDPSGYKEIPCTLSIDAEEQQLKRVQMNKGIFIHLKNDSFSLYFLDATTMQVVHQIFENEKKTKLYSALSDIKSRKISGDNKFCLLEDQLVKKEIYDLVLSSNGKIKKICFCTNRIYYIAGLFFDSLQKASDGDRSITQVIFERQFKEGKMINSYFPIFNQLTRVEKFYTLGLNKLRSVNSHLKFTGTEDNTSFSEEEKPFLEQAFYNQWTPQSRVLELTS